MCTSFTKIKIRKLVVVLQRVACEQQTISGRTTGNTSAVRRLSKEQIALNQRFQVLMILSSTTHTIEFADMYK